MLRYIVRSAANFYIIPLFAFKIQKHCTVAFHQQSSQETNKVGVLSQTYFHIKLVSRAEYLYIFTFISVSKICH
jgi:hypothetical protein